MFNFNLMDEPLTAPELSRKTDQLRQQRRRLIQYSASSDIIHGFIFIALFFSQALSGTGILLALAVTTAGAATMAFRRRSAEQLERYAGAALMSALVAGLIVYLLVFLRQEAPVASLIAALCGISNVILGATLGQALKKVMLLCEQLTPIVDDPPAQQQLNQLCQNFPELATYRKKAAQNLRPYLTYAELSAMEEWAAQQPQKTLNSP